MDRFQDILTFVRVVEARSFTGAAERLGLSKSVVSRRVAALEDHLGARLLNRTTRTLSPTEIGRGFYERCQAILSDLEEAERMASADQTEPRGLIRVNAPVSFGGLHLAPALAEFMTRYPKVEIDLTLNDRFVDLVDEGYDLAVRIGRLADSSLIARKLAPSRRAVVASPDYLRRRGVPQTPEDLKDHECFSYSNVSMLDEWQFRDEHGQKGHKVQGRFRVNNGDVMLKMVLAGLGIAVLPTFIVADALKEGRLRTVLDAFDIGAPGGVYAVYPHARQLSSKVRALVDFLAGRYGPNPYWDAALTAPPQTKEPAA